MSKTIFIIDSDPDTVEVVSYILAEAGYVVALPTSENLIADINSIRPDLILMDDWSELISVSHLMRTLKLINLLKDIPVLIFSTTDDLCAFAIACNANGFIKKPFVISELEEAISAKLSQLSEVHG